MKKIEKQEPHITQNVLHELPQTAIQVQKTNTDELNLCVTVSGTKNDVEAILFMVDELSKRFKLTKKS